MKNIFVGNLSFGVTEASVRSLFETHGKVDRVNICTDRDSGQPRGFGFVEMANDAEAEKAIAAVQRPGTGWPRVECQRSPPEDGSSERRRRRRRKRW